MSVQQVVKYQTAGCYTDLACCVLYDCSKEFNHRTYICIHGIHGKVKCIKFYPTSLILFYHVQFSCVKEQGLECFNL